MSANFCQTAGAASFQFGKNGAGIKATSATTLETRNAADTALVTMEVATPTADAMAATKKYVDDLVALSVTWKEAAVALSATAVTITAPGATIDGITMTVGDRIVLTGNTGTPSENGVWVWNGAAVALTRPADWATGSDQSGSVISIQEGTAADGIYIASADPAVVDTNDPVMLLIGSTAAGVTSVNDAVAVPSGGSSFLSSAGTGAVTMNVLDDSARISVTVAASVITLDIVALSIDTAQLAAQGVTAAKLDVNASMIRATFTVTFTDQGTTVTGPTLLANSRVVKTEVDVTTAFTDAAADIDVLVGAVSVQGTSLSDATIADVYVCDGENTETVAAAVVSATVGGSASTAGVAVINVYYYVTA